MNVPLPALRLEAVVQMRGPFGADIRFNRCWQSSVGRVLSLADRVLADGNPLLAL